MDGPVPFITIKSDGSFAVSQQAGDLIQKIEGKIGVISIAGLYRTGKSYILNRLAGSSRGFSIGSFVEPCTQGIHMWIVPKEVSKQHLNSDMTVILLDTEGLGSYKRGQNHDVKIFALALLLASSTIYNSMGSIDEGALDRLSLVAELSNRIKMQSGGENEDSYQLSRFFPKFFWVCRDFHLKLEVAGNPITATEYLENALKPLQGEPERVKSRNHIRQSICSFFTDRTGFVLRRPVSDEKQLQHLEDIGESDLRPQFLEGMNEFLKVVYTTLEPKQMFGETLTGRMLLQLTKSYISAMNEGGVPVIRSAWDNVIETECQRAINNVFTEFEQEWTKQINDAKMPQEEDELEKEYMAKERQDITKFKTMVKGAATWNHEQKLIDQLRSTYNMSKLKNHKKSVKLCEELLEEICETIETTVTENERTMTVETVAAEWETAIREKYLPAARGPAKFEILAQVIRKRQPQTTGRVHRVLVKQAQEEAERAMKKNAEKQDLELKKIEGLYTDVKANWVRSREEVSALAAENSKLLDLVTKFGEVVS